MAIPNSPTYDAATWESDSLQAAYLRGALAEQRAIVVEKITKQTGTLDGLSTRTDAMAIMRLQRVIRIHEAERRDLDRMIAALDRRFAPAIQP